MAALHTVEISKGKGRALYTAIIVILCIGIPIQVFPYLWMTSGMFKSVREAMSAVPNLIPKVWHPENIPETFQKFNLWNNFLNSMILCGGTILIQCTISTLAAYALSKLRPKGSNWVLIFFVGTMMISESAITIPTYLMFSNFFGHSLINSFWSLLLSFSAWGWAIFLLKGFFDGLPSELMESANIDGAGPLAILGRIVLPLSKPVLAVVVLNTFMAVYNQFMFPLVLLKESDKWTIMIRIYSSQMGNVKWNETLVMLTMATIPVMIVYLLAQKYVVQGISMTGLKG